MLAIPNYIRSSFQNALRCISVWPLYYITEIEISYSKECTASLLPSVNLLPTVNKYNIFPNLGLNSLSQKQWLPFFSVYPNNICAP